MTYRFVLNQMFDIRPLNKNGLLDFEAIKKVKKRLIFENHSEPSIVFANDMEINRDVLFAELETIERDDYKLKTRLMVRQVAIKCDDKPISHNIFINRKINNSFLVKSPEIDLFEEKAANFFEQKPVFIPSTPLEINPPVKTRPNFFWTTVVVSLIILNGFLAQPLAKQAKNFLTSKKINLYGSILQGEKGASFFANFSLINDFVKDYDVVLKFFGFQRPQKYLLIFQNNSEMRATGGFIGSYGVLDLDQGKIKNFFTDDIYNIDGQLQEKIEPPKPILKVADFWSMHDANWFADFPTSAQKIAWFYEKTGGPTVDGVISLTPTVIEQLLKITGPIELPEYNLIINSDNFVEEMQYQIEGDAGPPRLAGEDGKISEQPKKVLVDFVSRFFQKIQDLPKSIWPQIIGVLNQSLKEKHILFYFRDQGLENFVLNQKWGGQVLGAEHDYLSVINSNLGGSKTDWLIEEKIEHQAEIQADGSVIDTVKISRYHRGGQTKYEWWNKSNIDYLRVYAPLGAKLIAPEPAIEVFEESNKTVFAQWVSVEPGQTAVIEFKYLLPFKIFGQYSLLVQKQSGSLGSQFVGRIKTPEKEWENKDILKEDKSYEISL